MAITVNDLWRRDAELVRRAVDNALVGLVRDEPVDVVGAVAVALNASSTTSVIIATACLKTSRPPCGCPQYRSMTAHHRHRVHELMPAIRTQMRGETPRSSRVPG